MPELTGAGGGVEMSEPEDSPALPPAVRARIERAHTNLTGIAKILAATLTHDGAVPWLGHTTLTPLEQARCACADARQVLEETRRELKRAWQELNELTRGTKP